jgi:hypothetical protein
MSELRLKCALCGFEKYFFGLTVMHCWDQAEYLDGWIYHFCPECNQKEEFPNG